jgi:asparagine synthase (glutamine-hydrolysing)
VYLPNDPLVKVDRMAMAHGLEVRCPLLDHRVVELAFRIPATRKQVGRQGKTLLRALARRRLPEKLWQMPKRGFTVPIGSWIAGPHAGTFEEALLGGTSPLDSWLDRRDLRRRFDAHRAGQADQGYALWTAWTLGEWLRQVKIEVTA